MFLLWYMYVFHGMNLFFKITLTNAEISVFFPILVGKHKRLFLEPMNPNKHFEIQDVML